MLSKQHSRNISVPIPQALGSCENCSSPFGSEAKSATPQSHPVDGSPWRAHLASGPGFLAWPCLGPGLMGEARPAPDICQAQGVRGLGDSPLTHFSPMSGCEQERPGLHGPGFSPQPLSVLCLQDSVLGYKSVEDARAATELYRISRRIESSEGLLQAGGPLPGPETGLLSNTWK